MSYDLALETDLLRRFERDLESAGLVGEKRNAKVILLVAVSAKMQKPLNVSVGGSSSAGKNHLMGTVAQFIPDEDKKVLTGMTPKVLMHSEEREFQHKAVFIAEYEGVAGADFAVRTMQSEGVIEWEYVDSSSAGMKKKTKKVKGPAAFIQATTRAVLHPENETRLLFCQMDESAEQTQAINRRQAMDAEKKLSRCPDELYSHWHELLRSFEPRPVRISFATQLSEHLPKNLVRSRRDFPKLLGLIEASAFLHQHRRNMDTEGNIVATPRDYLTAKELFEHCYYAGPESKVGELISAAKQCGGDFSVADLMGKTGWGKSKTYLVLGRAEELGCIVENEKRGRYRLLRENPEETLNLPTKLKLTAADFRISTEGRVSDFHNSTDEGAVPPCGKSEKLTMSGGIPGGKAENALGEDEDLYGAENAAPKWAMTTPDDGCTGEAPLEVGVEQSGIGIEEEL